MLYILLAITCHVCAHTWQEGEKINTHITAAGAIVALGLVYLKTNNRQVAAHLSLPSTHYELDQVRPDFLMLRVRV